MPLEVGRIALQLRLSTALHEKIKSIAEAEMRSINAQMEYFLTKSVEQYEKNKSL